MNQNVIVYGLNFFDKIFNFEYEQCYDLEKFFNSTLFKVLIKREDIFYNNITYNINKRVKEYDELSKKCDLLIVYCDELHYYHYNSIGKESILTNLKNNKNILFVFPGQVLSDDYPTCNNLNWFKQCKEIYSDLNFKLKELNPFNEKEYLFDALMGTKRTHRDFVYKKITNSKFTHKILLSYQNNANSESWFRDDDLTYNFQNTDITKTYSNLPIKYYNKDIWISHQIPIGVYNKSAYSIVTETEYDNGICFPTEKTAKPFLAKRLFVVFSGVNYLKTLRKFGFKTFSNIIDESYDNFEDNEKRWEYAWQSVEQLITLPQEEVFKKIKPIVEHNFNHLMNLPYDDFVKKQCDLLLKNKIKNF